MARDIHDFTVEDERRQRTYQYRWWSYDFAWTEWSVPTKHARRSLLSERDEIETTVPINGTYVTPTDYYGFRLLSSSSPGSCAWENWAYGLNEQEWTGVGEQSVFYYGTNGPGNPSPALSGALVNRARQAAISQLQSDLNIGVVVGELTESITTIGGLVKKAATLLKGVRREMAKAALKGLSREKQIESAASAYLQVKFGILPIVSDIYSAIEAIQESAKQPIGFVKVDMKDQDYGPPPQRYHGDVMAFGPALLQGDFTGSKCERGIEIRYAFAISDMKLFQGWRYGITNPLVVAWELLTLSFVIDWFTGVGNFLAGLQQPCGTTFLSGYETHWLRNDITLKCDMVTRYFGTEIRSGSRWGLYNLTSRSHVRYRRLEFTGPRPYLDLGLNTGQVVTAVALLIARA